MVLPHEANCSGFRDSVVVFAPDAHSDSECRRILIAHAPTRPEGMRRTLNGACYEEIVCAGLHCVLSRMYGAC